MAQTKHLAVGIHGLDKFVKDLKSFDRKSVKAVSRGLRKATVFTQQTAWFWQSAGQRRPRTPTNRGAIRRFATPKGAGLVVKISEYPWAAPMEFGGNQAYLWGKTGNRRNNPKGLPLRSQSSLRSRQFRPWVGNQHTITKTSGYVAQRAVWEEQDHIAEVVVGDIMEELAKHVGGKLV